MKSITHKDITLIFGVLVAMVIVFTLWVRSPESTEALTPTSAPSIPTTPFVKTVLETTTRILSDPKTN